MVRTRACYFRKAYLPSKTMMFLSEAKEQDDGMLRNALPYVV